MIEYKEGKISKESQDVSEEDWMAQLSRLIDLKERGGSQSPNLSESARS